MTTVKFISVLFILSSCKTKTADNTSALKLNLAVKDTTSLTTHFSFIDTLNKYEGSDTLSRNGTVFYIGTNNKKHFGLIQTSDTSFKVFQKNKQSWYVSDNVKLSDIVNVNYSDLNGDNNKNVLIVQDYTGAGGNSENVGVFTELCQLKKPLLLLGC